MCQAIQVEGRDKLVAVSNVESDDGNGKQSGVVGTTSSGNIDSIRVEVESQHMCQSRRLQDENLPVSSGPPIQCAEHSYGDVRCDVNVKESNSKLQKSVKLENVKQLTRMWVWSAATQEPLKPCLV